MKKRLFISIINFVLVLIVILMAPTGAKAEPLPVMVKKWQGINWAPDGGSTAVWLDSPHPACVLDHDYWSPTRKMGPTTLINPAVALCDWEPGDTSPLPSVVFAFCVTPDATGGYEIVDFLSKFKGYVCDNNSKTPTSTPIPSDPSNPRTCGPVMLSNGSKYRQDLDFATADGLLRVERFYRSVSSTSMREFDLAYGGTIGTGWSLSNQWRIGESNSYEYEYTVQKADGGDYKFSLAADGTMSYATYLNYSDRDLSISLVSPSNFTGNYQSIKDNGARFRIRDSDGTIILMDLYAKDGEYRFGRVHSIQSPSGYTQTYAYAQENRISTITDSFNRKLTFTWAERLVVRQAGDTIVQSVDVTQITLPDGNKIEYGYDTINTNPDKPRITVEVCDA